MSFPRRAVSYLKSCDSVTDTAPWQIDTSSGLLASQEGIGIPNCVKQLQESISSSPPSVRKDLGEGSYNHTDLSQRCLKLPGYKPPLEHTQSSYLGHSWTRSIPFKRRGKYEGNIYGRFGVIPIDLPRYSARLSLRYQVTMLVMKGWLTTVYSGEGAGNRHRK